MRIIQLVAAHEKGGGVSNAITSMAETLEKMGYETLLIAKKLSYDDLQSGLFREDDILLYHLSFRVDPLVRYINCKKILVFHNITEPDLFIGKGVEIARLNCAAGLYETQKTHEYFDKAIADSQYNKEILIKSGWREQDVFVLPIIVRLDNFNTTPDAITLERYKDNKTNILFTGRVFPNKRHEDIIKAFVVYKEKYNKDSRLFLVGLIQSKAYYRALMKLTEKLGCKDDVIFTDKVSFSEYLAYYHLADLFLCMSEHEGFCIPLVEAMYFGLPTIAVKSTAVTETLDKGCVLLESRDESNVAQWINSCIVDEKLRDEIKQNQIERLKCLDKSTLEKEYCKTLNKVFSDLSIQTTRKGQEIKVDDIISYMAEVEICDELLDSEEPVIIYGFGAAGKKLYSVLKRVEEVDIACICDKNAKNKENTDEIQIMTFSDATSTYKNVNFVISVQKISVVFDIIKMMIDCNIDKRKIFLYSQSESQIYKI